MTYTKEFDLAQGDRVAVYCRRLGKVTGTVSGMARFIGPDIGWLVSVQPDGATGPPVLYQQSRDGGQIYRRETPKPPAASELKVPELPKLLAAARDSGLKRPVLRIDLEGCPPLRISMGRSGEYNVASGDRVSFYGRIAPDGELRLRHDAPPEVKIALVVANSDPVAFAREYGRRTGHCCFCGTELTRADSIAYGYGPICAERWGLPHKYWQEVRRD